MVFLECLLCLLRRFPLSSMRGLCTFADVGFSKVISLFLFVRNFFLTKIRKIILVRNVETGWVHFKMSQGCQPFNKLPRFKNFIRKVENL